jgi:hypothetical protein
MPEQRRRLQRLRRPVRKHHLQRAAGNRAPRLQFGEHRDAAPYGIYLSRDYQPDGLPLFLDELQRRLGETLADA